MPGREASMIHAFSTPLRPIKVSLVSFGARVGYTSVLCCLYPCEASGSYLTDNVCSSTHEAGVALLADADTHMFPALPPASVTRSFGIWMDHGPWACSVCKNRVQLFDGMPIVLPSLPPLPSSLCFVFHLSSSLSPFNRHHFYVVWLRRGSSFSAVAPSSQGGDCAHRIRLI